VAAAVVAEERVRKLHASMGAVVGCVMQWGIGLQDLIDQRSQ
jgi:hypothetical protein